MAYIKKLTIGSGPGGGYTTIQFGGAPYPQETTLNFIGSSVSIADDAGNSRTNVTFAQNLNDLASLTLAKGDVLTYNGTNLVNLGVGTNGTVLTADSAQADGIKWATNGYTTIQEGGVSLTQRAILNFIGASAVAADNAGATRTDVTFASNLNDIAGLTPSANSIITGNGTNYVSATPTIQQTIFVSKNGSDVTGNGSILFPYATIAKANSVITTASNATKFVVFIEAGRYDETSNVLLKPYVAYVGYGSSFSYITSPNNQVAPDPLYNNANGRSSLINLYIGGSTSINFDLSGLGTTGSCVLDLINVAINGGLTFIGRNLGADFIQTEGTNYWFGNTVLSNCQPSLYGGWVGGDFTLNTATTTGHTLYTINGLQIFGNTTIASTAGIQNAGQFNNVQLNGTLTISGATTTVSIDNNSLPALESNYTVSGGATVTYLTNCFGLAYTPAVPANWSPAPSFVNTALDELAASGVIGPFSAGSVIFSNGTKLTQDNAHFNWNDTNFTLALTQPSSLATLQTVLQVNSDPGGVHGHGNHIELAGNPGGGATIFRTDGGLNKSWIQIYGGPDSTTGGALYVNGNNSTGGDAGGVQTTFGLTTSTFDMYDNTQSVLLFQVNNSGVVKLPQVATFQVLSTDGSNNVTPISPSTAGFVLTSNGIGAAPTFQAAGGGGSGITWSVVTTNTSLVANHGYFSNSGSNLTFTLPASAAVGDTFAVSNMNSGNFIIAQNAGQSIRYGNQVTTTGAGGNLTSTANGDGIQIVCNVANTGFQVMPGSIGTINVT